MATALFAPTAAPASGEVEVTDTPVTVSINAPSGTGYTAKDFVVIELETSSAGYTFVGGLDANKTSHSLVGAGTYRLSKLPTPVAIGVDRSDAA